MGVDKAMIRLYTDFAQAKQQEDPYFAQIQRRTNINVRFNEASLQTTNLPDGIAFGDSYQVYVVDCCGQVLQNITDYVGIFEFMDINGKPQISFEIAYVSPKPQASYLKFVHAETGLVWWSNALWFSNDDYRYTTRFAYKGIGYDDNTGIDYSRSDFFHVVRLNGCFYHSPADEQETKGYNQDRGQKVNSRVRVYEQNKYIFEYSDIHSLRALNRILAQDVLYIEVNGQMVRCTNKPYAKPGDLIGSSNMLQAEFTTSPDWADTITINTQIISPLELLEYSPYGVYTLPEQPVSVWDDGLMWDDSQTWDD